LYFGCRLRELQWIAIKNKMIKGCIFLIVGCFFIHASVLSEVHERSFIQEFTLQSRSFFSFDFDVFDKSGKMGLLELGETTDGYYFSEFNFKDNEGNLLAKANIKYYYIGRSKKCAIDVVDALNQPLGTFLLSSIPNQGKLHWLEGEICSSEGEIMGVLALSSFTTLWTIEDRLTKKKLAELKYPYFSRTIKARIIDPTFDFRLLILFSTVYFI
jgi:hypothetical protein